MRLRLVALVSIAGCNFVYGLDETKRKPDVPPIPDRDLDDVEDALDNCIDTERGSMKNIERYFRAVLVIAIARSRDRVQFSVEESHGRNPLT